MLNRSCLGDDTPECFSSPGQLSSNFKSPKGVEDGELDTKSLYNNSEEDQLQHTGGPKGNMYVFVYVVNKNGNPLMPCKPAKARHLLKDGKAKVIRRTPFVIQLLWDCEENLRPINLGIDSAYSHIGYSATTTIDGDGRKKELISGTVDLRNDIPKKLIQRRNYRRSRRSRLWHREPRFLNRTHGGKKKGKGWIPPSLQHKIDSHIRLIGLLRKILPIDIEDITIEIASFDTQKMKNPEITGIEYQQGELAGYKVKEYLLEKWGRKCAYCGKTNVQLEVEHIIPKSRGGSDRPQNLTLACHECNQKKGNKTAEEFGYSDIQKEAKESLKAAPFMNLVRQKLVDVLGCKSTYGYITKHDRIKAGLEKSHVNDAFVIAGGGKSESEEDRSIPYTVTQRRRNNRSIQMNRKGHKPSIRRVRYNMQPGDLVRIVEEEKGTEKETKKGLYRVKGVFSYGKWIRLINEIGNVINTNVKNVKMVKYGKGIQFELNSG